jgi:sugar lactone lactonase YvrE
MKTKATETKFKSTLPLTRRLLSSVLCLGAVILTSSSAPAQNLFMSSNDGQTGVIFEFTPDGTQSTFASGLSNPQGLVFDSSGNLFVADSGAIYKFSPDGVRTTFALGLSGPIGLAIDSADNLFVADGAIYKFTPEGVRSTFASGLEGPWALATDGAGNLFVTDSLDVVGPGHAHVYKFTPDGVRTTIASGLLAPEDLAFDSEGNLFVLEGGDIDGLGAAIYKFTPAGRQTTFASPFLCIGPGLAIDSADNLFVPDWCTGSIHEFTPNRVQTTFGSGSRSAGYLAFQSTETSPPTATPRVTVSVSANRISQGADATFTISVSTMNPSQVTTVHYAMSGKARSGTNYTLSGVSGEADIPAGASSTTVTLHALTGPMRGKTKKATLTVMPATNYTLSNPKKASVTILKAP